MTMNITAAYVEQSQKARDGNPFGLLVQVIREKQSAGTESHKKAFKRLLKSEGYEDDLDRALDEWLSIKYSTALSAAIPPTASEVKLAAKAKRQSRSAAAEERQTKASAIVEKIKQIVLLDLEMPNGKKLRDCTGYECTSFGERYLKVGEAVGKRRTVGKALSEDALRDLML